jgi:hypothetical protein
MKHWPVSLRCAAVAAAWGGHVLCEFPPFRIEQIYSNADGTVHLS